MPLPTEILFRADASPDIGTGHVMRCLALANACRATGVATRFVGTIQDGVLCERIQEAGHQLVMLDASGQDHWIEHVRGRGHWVVLDGYEFGTDDHRRIRGSGAKLLVIDDMAELGDYEADIVLNQNFHADAAHYRASSGATMLMGPRFALLREEFIKCTPPARGEIVRRVLVTLGGADPHGVGLIVADALVELQLPLQEVLLIAGSSNPWLDRLEFAAARAREQGHVFELRTFTADMPGAMAWADCAVIAAGTTSLEIAYMGLPSLVVTLADNQIKVAAAMHAQGVAESLGWYESLTSSDIAHAIRKLADDAARRKDLSERGREMVDGMGARRVTQIMLEQSHANH
jgi:UDP-2,4-diacetamido-2,4,6-trideoxy-beta-L-altropyranose hydrolase